ncbi:MAG: deoxyribose-phosphate aldolase [Tannerella sp.]|jgi:deoxyribose-phosphate aldolase|nr:deoxyribose-phosphate aldolase [Tannerella sp.]
MDYQDLQFEHFHEHAHTDKYRATLKKFDSSLTDEKAAKAVKSLLDVHYAENFTPAVLKHIHGCIDITTLNTVDTRETVWNLVEKKVNDYEGSRPDVPNIAAICVCPNFVETVKQALTAADVKIASVAGGFPLSQTFTEVKIAETAMAVMNGAEEIDIVMNLGYFFEEDYEALADEISEIKESCRGATLKVILETGALKTAENIRKAAILALYSGADFIKSSTGKDYPGATPEAIYVMCRVLKEYVSKTGIKAGIKVSGGIRTPEDAVRYYTIVKETLGLEYTDKSHFRIGASSLLDALEKAIV